MDNDLASALVKATSDWLEDNYGKDGKFDVKEILEQMMEVTEFYIAMVPSDLRMELATTIASTLVYNVEATKHLTVGGEDADQGYSRSTSYSGSKH